VGREVLEGVEALAEGADVSCFEVERDDGLAQREVAGRPGARAREVAGEEPVGRPFAEAANGHEPGLHLVVGKTGQPLELDRACGQAEDVLGLAPREAEHDEVFLAGAPEPLRGRERVRLADAAPVALDQAVADREGCVERDLLGGDRGDEGLERVGGERRPEAGKSAGQPSQDGVLASPGVKGLELELGAEQLAHRRAGLGIERLDPHASGRGLDAHLASADDSVERAVVPEVREVRPEGTEALGRELEVEGLGQPQQRHYSAAASAWKSVSGRYGTPRSSSQPARLPVAKTRSAAREAQWSEWPSPA